MYQNLQKWPHVYAPFVFVWTFSDTVLLCGMKFRAQDSQALSGTTEQVIACFEASKSDVRCFLWVRFHLVDHAYANEQDYRSHG